MASRDQGTVSENKIHTRIRFHLPDDKPKTMLNNNWQKQQPVNKRSTRLSWLLRFFRRRPLTALFVSTAILAGSVPCMLFLGFVFITFIVSFVVFVIAESSLVGAGLFALVLVLSVPLCCAAASTACLLACWLSPGFSLQYGGACWNDFSLLGGCLCSSQDKELNLCLLKPVRNDWEGHERIILRGWDYGKIKPLLKDVMWQVHQIDNFVAGWLD